VILDGITIMQIEKMPLTGIAPFAIPDDPAIYEEKKAPSFQQSLFVFSDDDEEGGDDA
jgi:hypothetical protein